MSICKPRARRAQMMTVEESDMHVWLARFAVNLSIIAEELPAGALKRHARKTLDEFISSGASSETLARFVRDEVKG